MKKTIKRFLIVALMMLVYIPSKVYGVAGLGLDDNANTTIVNAGGNFLGIAQIVAIGVATIMLVVLAIKYIVSSPGDKAEIKKHAVVYIVGAVFIYGSVGILNIIQAFAREMGS